MGRLTRDQIVAQVELRTEVVEVPEWGGSVVVRELSGRERDVFEASIVKRHGQKTSLDMENMRARFVAACVIGDDGQPLFYPSDCLLYTSPSPRDRTRSRMPSSA